MNKVLATVIIFSAMGMAQERAPEFITVFGVGEAKCSADRAKLVFDVEGLGSSHAEAFIDAKDRTQIIVKKLIKLGIPKSGISTSSLNSIENWNKGVFSSKKDFKSRIAVAVNVDSLSLLEPVIITIGENKANSITYSSFTLRDKEPERRKARDLAVANANLKATQLVKEIGIGLGKPVSIEEIPYTVDINEKARIPTDGSYSLNFNDGGRLFRKLIADPGLNTSIFPEDVITTFVLKVTYGIERSGNERTGR